MSEHEADPTDDLRAEARAALALQLAISGPIRYLDAPLESYLPPDERDAPESTPELAPEPTPPTDEQPMTPESQHAEATMSPYERIAALVPADSPLNGFATMDEVATWVSETVLIPIDAERQNAVFGTGNINADLMVIGEAPGAEEDKTGEPFVGRAGQLLDKILEAVGFDRTNVYIANILKSRPPGNRDPQADEVAAHIPILHKQISLVQPKVILAVGKSAGNGLLGTNSSLADMREAPQDFHGIPLFVTYHPAALLRNSNWKRPTWEDVQAMRTRYDELTQP